MRKGCKPNEQNRIKIYRTLAELPKEWDALLPEGHELKSNALALYEAIQLPDINHYYALCGSEQEPKAIAYFQLLAVKTKHINQGLLNGFQAFAVPLLLNITKPKLLIAGHLFRHDIVNFCGPNLSNIEAFRAYEAMIQAVAKKSCAMATLIKDVPDKMVTYFRNFAPHYHLLRNDISMQMQIPKEWQSFDDYEKALKHKYAQKLRKVRSSMADVRIVELSAEEVQHHSSTIFSLYQQVSQHQSISLGLLNAQFLPKLKTYYGEKLKVWAFYESDKMVAFASAWLHDECFDMFYIGFDYERNADLSLYFNILYFSIEQAILYQKPKLNLGRTALEAKARLGCMPRYLPTFLFVRSRYLRNIVASKMNNQHQQEGTWEERHPLKNV